LDALPCPALPLPLPCPVSNLPFDARDRRRKLHRELFFFFFPVGGSAPLDSVTVGGGVRFDGSLVAGMDETSVRLDG